MNLFIFSIMSVLLCGRLSALPVEQNLVTDVGEATAFPDLQKSYVDIKNVSPEVSLLMQDNNISLDVIIQKQQELQNKTRYVTVPPTFPPPTAPKEIEDQARLENIKNALERTLRRPNEDETAEFDYSLLSVCEMPRSINLSTWFDTDSWNILFKPNYKQFNVKSVSLRIFKVSTINMKPSGECDTDSNEFYKIVVSVYQKKNKELKKRIIFAKMVPNTYSGWIEIDALLTVKLWDSNKKNLGLAVDVYDQDENQLNAKNHFALQNCQAVKQPPIPWRGLELLAKTSGSSNTKDVLDIFRNVYTGPRLDLVSSSPADYTISSSEEKKRARRHHGHRASSEESFHHKSHQNGRLHRGSSSVEET